MAITHSEFRVSYELVQVYYGTTLVGHAYLKYSYSSKGTMVLEY